MGIYEILENRRSVRKYKPDKVSDQVLEKLLDAARVAPSWKNQQCWRFIVVREPERKKQLADSMPDNNPAKRAVGETAPIVLVLCADPEASGKQDGKDYYLLDAGLALQQLMLAAHAEGLGTCWVAWFNEEKVRSTCAVPNNYRVVALTPLGVPQKQPSARPRKDLEEIAYTEQWGNAVK